jgi:hypothetical protein
MTKALYLRDDTNKARESIKQQLNVACQHHISKTGV